MARKNGLDYDLVVIGSGAAGSNTALAVAKQGKKVAIVEGGTFGGQSPNWGDIPVKALLHTAKIYQAAKNSNQLGIRGSMLSYNFPLILGWKDKVVARTGVADNKKFYEKNGIETVSGIAHFISPHEISVNRRRLTAKYFVVATGSRFDQPDVYGIDTIAYQTPRSLLESRRLPKSLFIVGSDSEALEYAQLFATFGTKVYICEKSSRLFPEADSEVGELFEKHLAENYGISTLTQTQLVGVEKRGLGIQVSFAHGNSAKSITVDEVLFLNNRAPNTDLGLENATVEYNGTGIVVNDYLQTSAKHIFAGGEVVNETASTQVAIVHGRIMAHNILHKPTKQPELSQLPRVTYTDPEIASVGLSENDCIKRDIATNVGLAPLTLVPRSNVSNTGTGFVKIIADKKGTLLGATVVAPGASDMIGELSLAINRGLAASDVADTPHAFLSWGEAVRSAAMKLG